MTSGGRLELQQLLQYLIEAAARNVISIPNLCSKAYFTLHVFSTVCLLSLAYIHNLVRAKTWQEPPLFIKVGYTRNLISQKFSCA